MKIFIAIIIFIASMMPVFSASTDKPSDLKIGTFVELPTGDKPATGFLKYVGQHKGVTFCALSADIGSAVPSEDFRLYTKTGDKYRLILSLPMLDRKGYKCVSEADILKVYLTRKYEDNKALETKNIVLSINLEKFIE